MNSSNHLDDPIGQLTAADSSVNTEDRGYKYDRGWNLNWRTNNGLASQFVVGADNELTTSLGQSNTFDANGNMTASYGWESLTYDDENRLIQISDNTNHTFQTTFAYDGLGRLRKRLDGSWNGKNFATTNTVEYIYDGWRVIQERDGSNNPLVSYTRGTDLSGTMEGAGGIGGLLARSSGYSSGNFTNHGYYFADGNGNITYMLGSSQTCLGAYRYDAFGNTISTTSGSLANANVYRFSSKEIHPNTGMYYYLFRFYDPNLQTWINRDPVQERGGVNLYGFVLNRPVGTVDLWGQFPLGGPEIKIPPWLWPILFPPEPPPTPTPEPVLPPAPTPGLGPLAFCLAMSPVSCGDPTLGPDGAWWCNGKRLPGPFGSPPPNPNVETCDRYGPGDGKTCWYWCKKSQRWVRRPGHPDGCPDQWTGDPYHPDYGK